MILESWKKFIRKILPKKKAVDPYYECYPNHLPRLMKELEKPRGSENGCTLTPRRKDYSNGRRVKGCQKL